MFVLGVDPGLSRCGYAVLDASRRVTRPVALGVIKTSPSDAVPRRLHDLSTEITALLDEHPPAVVAVERVFFSVNVRTAIGVAQAAGVTMSLGVGAGAEVVEYTPNEVKQAVTGDGSADKHQVEAMVQRLLGITKRIRPVDAADAAAVALCHLARAPMLDRLAAAGGAR